MIVDLPGLVGAVRNEARHRRQRGRVGRERPVGLDVDRRTRREHRGQTGQYPLEFGAAEGRIEKDQVEAVAGVRQVGRGVALHHLDRLGIEPLAGGPQRRRGARVAFDQHHLPGAARRGLQPQCAGAGIQVEASPAVEALAQPVEQRLAHPVGRGPQARCVDDHERRALPVAADDPHLRGRL